MKIFILITFYRTFLISCAINPPPMLNINGIIQPTLNSRLKSHYDQFLLSTEDQI